MIETSTLVVFVLCIILANLAYYCYKLREQVNTSEHEVERLNRQYAPIVDVDQLLQQRKSEIKRIELDVEKLRNDYAAKRTVYESLLQEINLFESKLEDISYGLYEPVYNYSSSDQYKEKLEVIHDSLKQLIKEEKAVSCPVEWSVGGSRAEGRRMTKQYAKLMLRAFNGDCDAAIARVSWNNMGNMEARIAKSYEAINKLGSVNQSTIIQAYYGYKIAELRLEFELQQKLQAEKEEQRMIREQMREEEKAQREIETAQRKAEDEEAKYQKALAKATEEAKRATGDQLASLDQKIKELEQLLTDVQLQKERALSMAQQTKSGHVYIISNIGSFGEDVFKIGMTRRLEPMDRVKELGDASVPFCFDVHAMVYSDNAPDLEYKIHKQLAEKRINLINNRREFFRVELDEVEDVFGKAGHPLTLTKLAEAKEYRESIAIRESQIRADKELAMQSAMVMPLTLD
ncbi:DUF4041 domain-containing protein [Spirosoma sp. RP8]|uniref:DUF4041 domain-containing protein n=2 Tax=Spirosoma TaxID=107 RepID=A0ABT0HFI6_9BACT|nr:DUF4041 domain-containing protein [Spirosoma liriopis]MCK8490433.1 DUF4041 domain-containing protein [Spirosoma liriopis]